MRKLFARRPHPYYIYAYDFRRNSAGIRALHMLCDALNRSGQEAYVVAGKLSPNLITPTLTDEVRAYHRAQGITPVVVYPEVVEGNPLQGQAVVRYLLNKPGYLKGSGQFGIDDLIFAYKPSLLPDGVPSENVLYLPVQDLSVFRPPVDPSTRVPGLVCYYQGREGQAIIDPKLLSDEAIEITQTFPPSWEALADLFQRCEFFYCGEPSALAGEAALCGCLSIILPGEHAPSAKGYLELSGLGVAGNLAPEEVERAQRTLPELRPYLLEKQEKFWVALDHFIERTQQYAQGAGLLINRRLIEQWLVGRTPTNIQQRLIEERLELLADRFSLQVIVLDESGDDADLKATLASLERIPLIDRVEIQIFSPRDELSYQDVGHLSLKGLLPVEAINKRLQSSVSDWLLIVRAGDTFLPSGLLIVALELTNSPDCRAIYCDGVYRQSDGTLSPALRPDMNLDYLLSFPLGMASNWLFHRQTLVDNGGFDGDFPSAYEFAYQLRLIENGGIAGIGHIPEPLLAVDAPVMLDKQDEIRALENHLKARGYEAGSVVTHLPGRYHLNYAHSQQPMVSILVPTKDQLSILRRCIESLLETTAYPNYEIIVIDNNSETPEALEWLARLEQLAEDKLRVLRYPLPFNFSAINNAAARVARGEYLVLLNNDTAIISPDWLDELLNHAQRPEVGIVGAKLLFPNKTVQHAGVVLGLRGPADHPFIGEKMDAEGYMQRLQVDQNYSAVTAACLMIRKSIYFEVGGMDEEQFKVSYNDVDLCLKVGAAGHLIVWTPHSVLLHEGSVSQKSVDHLAADKKRQRFIGEQDAMYSKWLSVLGRDPAYNPNLSLQKTGGFKLTDLQLCWRPLDVWRPLPVVLAHPADETGCGQYRIIQPFSALQTAGLIDGALSRGLMHVTDLERYDPDVVVLQRQISNERLEAMRRMRAFSRAFKVYELDDYLPNLPLKSVHRSHMPKDIVKSLRRGLGYVDRFVVSTEAIAEAFADFHPDIQIRHNTLDPRFWSASLPESERRNAAKPRVGWAGGASHTGDLEMIEDVIKALAGEVEWVFFGMCPDRLRPYIHEYHPGVPIAQYPAALARLNLDLALAPVEQNLFNECKSNLRLLEYGACGYPVICSDVRCYSGDLPVTRVKNRYRDWVDAIRMHLSDPDASEAMGNALREQVKGQWMLEGANLDRWREVWLPG